jgi:hypothetical protein
MLPLHLGVARITALVPLASWVALVAVIAWVAVIALVPLAALVALIPLIPLIMGLRLGQTQGCAGNAHQGEPADGSCDGVHEIPFYCRKRALRVSARTSVRGACARPCRTRSPVATLLPKTRRRR